MRGSGGEAMMNLMGFGRGGGGRQHVWCWEDEIERLVIGEEEAVVVIAQR